MAHTEWDCWYNPKNKDPTAVARRAAKAKAQPGKGGPRKGKGKGRGSRERSVNTLEEQDWSEQSGQPDDEPAMSMLFPLSTDEVEPVRPPSG